MRRTGPAPFRRRHYHGIAELWGDLRRLGALRGAGMIAPAPRERLMLTVTAVNRCRYCASYHAQAARLSGLTAEEVALLLGGSSHGAPEHEILALSYARRWAETSGSPGPELHAQLAAHYGAERAAAIERMLIMIWIGNLLGNTWDAILHRLSGGRLGNDREEELSPHA